MAMQRKETRINMQTIISTLSIKDAMRQTQIGERTIRNAVDLGDLKAIRLGQRRIRIRPESLESWLRSLETSGQK
jgi:excisionase family DNA binding protein